MWSMHWYYCNVMKCLSSRLPYYCGSGQYLCPPQGGELEFPMETGGAPSRTKPLKESLKTWNFQRNGRRCENVNPFVGGL